jgi:hypothetical protein
MPQATAADLLGTEFHRCILDSRSGQKSEHWIYVGADTPGTESYADHSAWSRDGLPQTHKIPLRDFSQRGIGIAYRKENAKAEVMRLSGHHLLTDPWQAPTPLSV